MAQPRSLLNAHTKSAADRSTATSARRSGIHHSAGALILGVSISLAPLGCASDSSVNSESRSTASAASSSAEQVAKDVERKYVIGPAAARRIGYRIDWQQAVTIKPSITTVQHDSVLLIDRMNVLTRFKRETGDRLWQLQVAEPLDEVLGITYLPELNRIYLTTGSAVLELDATTGSQLAKQRLTKIANTEPVVFNQFLIYGSRDGQLVWHNYRHGTWSSGYGVSQSIQIAPVLGDGYLIAVGNDGRIMNLKAGPGSQVWSRFALDKIVAEPVIGNDATYVASTDQWLRAFDLREARTPLWAFLAESALTDSPVLIGDSVYQQVPGHGLHCFEALPLDSPSGVVRWIAGEAAGNVVTSNGSTVYAWNDERHRIEMIDARLGAMIDDVELPQVDSVIASSLTGGDLFAIGANGRIERLVPRN